MVWVFDHYKTMRTKKANKATGRITSSDKTLIELGKAVRKDKAV